MVYSDRNAAAILEKQKWWNFQGRETKTWHFPKKNSIYVCFLKWWYPQNTPKWSFLVGKPIVAGYHHWWNPSNLKLSLLFFCIFRWLWPRDPRGQKCATCTTIVGPPLERTTRVSRQQRHHHHQSTETSWWLNQPIWKICNRQIGSFPQVSGWK